jgi:O-antigen/teichoic acid export membrane protein
MPTNTALIAKNTLLLYFRQILIMLVSLYTVRVVLNTLGAEDYGIYNVVTGVVTMFGFLSGSMATASQRYFSFELGKGDLIQLQNTFSLTLVIYIMITALILFLAETAGLWFISNKASPKNNRYTLFHNHGIINT